MTEELNPYSPPQSEITEAAETWTLEDAGKGRRFGTFLVDQFSIILFMFIIGLLIGILFGKDGVAMIERMPDLIFGYAITLFFYALFEGIWARTPGKLIFGTVVVTQEGGRPPFAQILKRTLCRIIPFEPLSFFGNRGGWHDRFSKTRVIRNHRG